MSSLVCFIIGFALSYYKKIDKQQPFNFDVLCLLAFWRQCVAGKAVAYCLNLIPENGMNGSVASQSSHGAEESGMAPARNCFFSGVWNEKSIK